MISIKISADNERLFRAAKSEGELRGALDLVIERCDQAHAIKAAGKERPAKSRYNWKTAVEVLGAVLGRDLKYPPFPDPIWYQRVHRGMMNNDLTTEKLTALAEYCRTNLKAPYSLDFLVNQYEKILEGNYDAIGKRGSSSDAGYLISNWRKNNALPEE